MPLLECSAKADPFFLTYTPTGGYPNHSEVARLLLLPLAELKPSKTAEAVIMRKE